MRFLAILSLLALTACSSYDDTPMWKPGIPAPPPPPGSMAGPADPAAAGRLVTPETRSLLRDNVPSRENPPPRYEPPSPEPSITSGGGLTDSEYRSLQSVRQSLDSEISDLERRSHFKEATAAEQRRLRTLKSRRRDVVRQLRGG